MSASANLKKILRSLTPPFIWQIGKYFFTKKSQAEWQYVPEGWSEAEKSSAQGWNDNSIIEAQRKKWPEFLVSLEKTKPLGISHEATAIDNKSIAGHNTIMSFAYVLALASTGKSSIAILDWGGGVGHYYLIAKTLYPNLKLNYTIKDLPLICKHGPSFVNQVTFDDTNACLEKKYELVFSSAALYYDKNWQQTLQQLATATTGYAFITRLPTVTTVPSFVTMQRPHRYGYNTEYYGWCLNQDEFIGVAEKAGLKLVREFITGERVVIQDAPEPCQMKGFLFKK